MLIKELLRDQEKTESESELLRISKENKEFILNGK